MCFSEVSGFSDCQSAYCGQLLLKQGCCVLCFNSDVLNHISRIIDMAWDTRVSQRELWVMCSQRKISWFTCQSKETTHLYLWNVKCYCISRKKAFRHERALLFCGFGEKKIIKVIMLWLISILRLEVSRLETETGQHVADFINGSVIVVMY